MSVIQGLLGRLMEEPDEIEIDLPGLGVLKFRRISDASEWYRLSRSAKEWFHMMQKGLAPPDLLAVAPASEEIAQAAYLLAHSSIEPTKISELEACQIAKHGGTVFWEMVNRLKVTTLESITANEEAEIDAAGEG